VSTVRGTVDTSKTPANRGARDSRATGGLRAESGPKSAGAKPGAVVRVPHQALASLTHGGHGSVALAPQVGAMKQALLKRMGLRQADLTWAGRETLGADARTLAKLKGIEDWLRTHPMLDEDGTPAPCMQLFSTLSNTATRQLGELRAVVGQMSREDDALRRHLAERYGEESCRAGPRSMNTSQTRSVPFFGFSMYVSSKTQRRPLWMIGSRVTIGNSVSCSERTSGSVDLSQTFALRISSVMVPSIVVGRFRLEELVKIIEDVG
jgi:hypothetical protein